MSAGTASAMSGGNAAPGNSLSIQQSTDALQRKNIPQASEADDKPGNDAATYVAKDSAVTTNSADRVRTDQDETPAATPSSKGKQIDDSPEPAAQANVPQEEEDYEEYATRQDTTQQDVHPQHSAKDASPNAERPKGDKQEESIMAIGPAQEEIKPAGSGAAEGGPVCNITLLLTSGGRHPYKIDAKYLSRRHVAMPDQDDSGNPDPFSISIYTLKELILREWRSDWEVKPISPSSIRLIHFGKLLDDKEQLKKYKFSPDSPNVVHMSIRPLDLDEEEPKSGSKSLPAGATDGDGVREGRCCIVL
ncbi:hypothetical protein Trco_003829 [Trichoderma cornu-damae]|uniref:Ubiquitin-like domain-containing protein n=1 Tax=Trichoderma cornu-damae TaxID=654480 RepID=A0A9P8QLS8_9HYPO|nr:hypothetical protein Trco_003829 [Trichoderma cornu-damae]